MLIDFVDYLKSTTEISEITISNYERGVRASSKQMIELNIIEKPFEEMNLSEFEIAFFLTLQNDDFLKKDSVGHRMYSRGLKQFQSFLKDTQKDDAQKIIDKINSDVKLKQTEKEAIIKSRVGQGNFRKKLIEKYSSKCIVSGVDDARLLIASHIKPWAVCSNDERLDIENGFLLNALFDKMFDLGIITFKNDGGMLISNSFKRKNLERLNINLSKSYEIKATEKLLKNLEYHRDAVFVQ